MDIHQLRTFVAVAAEGSITRASERLNLSQPAVSAHIKAMETMLGLTLFDRTPKGMSLTLHGERLMVKARDTLAAHRALLAEAADIKGNISGRLRIGGGANSGTDAVSRLIAGMAERHPHVDVTLSHADSSQVLRDVRAGHLDAGFYNETGEPEPGLNTLEVGRFAILLAAPRGMVDVQKPLDWQALSALPWIYPAVESCCSRTAERLFQRHGFRPEHVIGIDRESMTRTMIAEGVGLGLLHSDTATRAIQDGEIDILCEAHDSVRVLFVWSGNRTDDPILNAACTILEDT